MSNSLTGLTLATTLSLAGAAVAAQGLSQKDLARGLLERGLAQGDRGFIMDHVAEGYIQHNPQAADRRQGLLDFVDFIQTMDPPMQVTPLRVITDGAYTVVHQESEFFGPKVIIDVFRFEDGKIAEHWDSIQDRVTKTANGRTMTDGATEISDLDKTEANKALVQALVSDVLIGGNIAKIDSYIRPDYRQHNPYVADTRDGLKQFISYLADNNIAFGYEKVHLTLGEGNFVFTQSEGIYDGAATAFYDLWRVEDGKIAEHWHVVQTIPTEFAHDNGMF